MKKAFLLALAVLCLGAAPAAAVTDLWALDQQSGEPASMKGFPSKYRIFSAAEHKKLNAGLQKQYSQPLTYCNQEFMVSNAQKRWIATHEKAGHRIVLRERLPKGKHRNVC